MPTFQYKARSVQGHLVEGSIEASSADSVATQIVNAGNTPVKIEEVTPKQEWHGWADLKKRLGIGRPSLDDLVLFCRQMYTLLHAGVPIIRAIQGLAETSRNKVFGETLREIRMELETGRELSAVMGDYPDTFSAMAVSLARVGENTGQLDESFRQLGKHLELERDTRARIKTAMRYPTFVLIGISVAIGVINMFVIPKFASVFEGMGEQLPWQTRLLIGLSEFMLAYWPALLILIGIAMVGTHSYIQTEPGRFQWDRLKLRLPKVGGIILRATLARFARSFAMTSRAGVPLIQALTVVARAVDNAYVSERILNMRNGIERGDSLTRTAAATSMFTPLVLQMISVGEETGAVDDMLDEVAGYYEREVDHDLKTISSAIEPVLIVAVGIMVLILALGVFLPMWEMSKMAG